MPRRFLLALLLSALPACQRGCARDYLEAHRDGLPVVGPAPERGAGFALSGTDCPDGLARCLEGTVEVSRLGHVPADCASRQPASAGCACPWEAAGECASGCVAADVTIVMPAAQARVQLCAPSSPAPSPPPRPPAAGAVAADGAGAGCDEDEYRCEGAVVFACVAADFSRSLRPVDRCPSSCAADGAAVPRGDGVDDAIAVAILCAR